MPEFTLGFTRLLGHGRAFSEVLPRPAPAVATGFTYTNDGQYWELVDSLSFQVVTDANAANRLVVLTVKDGSGGALATVPSAAATTASKTAQYTYLQEYSATTGATDGPFLNVFPALFLQPMFSFTVAVTNIQVADQISNIRIYAERFVTGPQGYRIGYVDEPTMWEERRVRLSELVA